MGYAVFVEPRFQFALSAHKAHLGFAPSRATLNAFRAELRGHETTQELLKLPYTAPLPETLIRKIAEYQLRVVSERESDGFW